MIDKFHTTIVSVGSQIIKKNATQIKIPMIVEAYIALQTSDVGKPQPMTREPVNQIVTEITFKPRKKSLLYAFG